MGVAMTALLMALIALLVVLLLLHRRQQRRWRSLSRRCDLMQRELMAAQASLRAAPAATCDAGSAGSSGQIWHGQLSHCGAPIWFETALLHALERAQFTLCYQPRLDLKTQQVKGVKALLRWKHPERGLVLPFEFLPVLEQSALILSVGTRMLAGAAAQARRWSELGRPLTVSVSLSARQFYHPDTAPRFAAILRSAGLPGRFIELEISAHILLDRNQNCDAIWQRFRALGVGICITDVGRDGAALDCLERYPADLVRIEKSLLDELRGAGSSPAAIRAVIAMARRLKLTTVACGVESDGQLARLAELGCDQAFGYCLSPALGAAALDVLLERWPQPSGPQLSRPTARQKTGQADVAN